MAKAKTFRVKVRNEKGLLKTIGKAKTERGLKNAYSRARAKHSGDITVVTPEGKKHTFGSEVKHLTGKE